MPRRGLEDVLAKRPARSVDEALARMREVLAAIPAGDGIARFTRLYLAVTEEVAAELERARFRDARFLTALDVAFANLFFSALAAHLRDPATGPRAWAPLVEARRTRGIAPIQFALAGMNAHINADLPIALVDTWRRLRVDPRRNGPQHADFLAVNRLLARTEERAKLELATGLVGELDEALGSLDDVLAMWKVERARDAAWANGETLWALRGLPGVRRRFLLSLDRMVGFAGRGLLRPLV